MFPSHLRRESSRNGRDSSKDTQQGGKTASIFLDAEKPLELKSPTPMGWLDQVPAGGRNQTYCQCCDNCNYFLNQSANFKQLSQGQKENWIWGNNRWWRCGRGHQAVNERPEEADKARAENSSLVSNASGVLCGDRPTDGRKVLLKVSEVLLRKSYRQCAKYPVAIGGSPLPSAPALC